MSVVLGTAGHIDHGKTALVRALTGVDTDRLPVEKARGITTELGFARLGDIAFVDVPGHERFVKSMVAGATGFDLACLVIAADEGVMPQTREHLDICDLLQIRGGVVALTKRDLVDDEWLALVTAEVRAAIAGTFLAAAPIVPVSAKTGAGLGELRAAIERAAAALPARTDERVFRLPIDRVFTVKGFGTVVTGTILGGAVALEDEVQILPGHDRRARVRGIEVHGAAVSRAIAGQRAALNLGGVAVAELARGDLLAHPGTVAASHILDVELRALAAPIAPRAKVLLHHGTRQVMATLALLDQQPLAAGATALAQLRVPASEGLGALPGDRFIVRGTVASPTHGSTLGGGRIVRVLAPRARKGHAPVVAALASARRAEQIALEVRAAGARGLALPALVNRLGIAPAALADALATLVDDRTIALDGARYLDPIFVEKPAPKPAPRAPANLSPAEAALLARFAAWGVEPPRPKELPPADQPLVARLAAGKHLVRIKVDYYVHADVVADVRARLLAHLDAHRTIDAAQWKALTGASRKFTIPLAEHFDAEKLTLRVGNLRRRR